MSNKVSQKNIPKGWQRVRLGEVAQLRKGLTYKSSHYSNAQDGLTFLTLKSIRRGGGFNVNGIKYYAGDFDSSAIVGEGDLVIANTDITRDAEVVGAPMLLPLLPKTPALISMDLSVLDIDSKKVNKNFLYYILQSRDARNFMKDHSNGSTVLHLKTKDVPEFSFLIPTIKEQEGIAEILGSIDNEMQRIDEIIVTNEKLKRGLMRQLFTKGKLVFLDSVAKRGSGHTPNKQHSDYWNGGIKWVSLADSSKLDNRYIFETDKEVSLNGIKNSSAVLHKKNSVIVCRDAGIGRVAILGTDDMAVSQHFIAWECSEKLNYVYLYYWLQSKREELEQIATGTTIKTIGLSFFKKLQVPLLGLNEQSKIGDMFWMLDEKTLINQNLKTKLALLKKGLMQDLLSGKARVNV